MDYLEHYNEDQRSRRAKSKSSTRSNRCKSKTKRKTRRREPGGAEANWSTATRKKITLSRRKKAWGRRVTMGRARKGEEELGMEEKKDEDKEEDIHNESQ